MTLSNFHGLLRSIAIFTSAVALIFVADFIVPANQFEQTVISRNHQARRKRAAELFLRTETETFYVDKKIYNVAPSGTLITIYKTNFLDIIKTVKIGEQRYPTLSVYTFYGILPLLVLLSGLMSWKKVNQKSGYTTLIALNVATFLFLILAHYSNKF